MLWRIIKSFLPTTKVNIAAEGVSITKSESFRSLSMVSFIVSIKTLLLSKTTAFVFLPSSLSSDAFWSPLLEDRILDANLDLAVLLFEDLFFFPDFFLVESSLLFLKISGESLWNSMRLSLNNRNIARIIFHYIPTFWDAFNEPVDASPTWFGPTKPLPCCCCICRLSAALFE